MRAHRLPIRRQILLGFGILLVLWIALIALALFRAGQLRDSTEIMHAHPMHVRDAAQQVATSVLTIRWMHRDLLRETDSETRASLLRDIEEEQRRIEQAMSVLVQLYLGPKADLERVRRLIREWSTERTLTLELVSRGQADEARARMLPHGSAGIKERSLTEALAVVDDFARRKASTLLDDARDTNREMTWQLLLFSGAAVFLSFFVMFLVLRNFRRPLEGFLRATQTFSDARPVHAPVPPNEFGELDRKSVV